MPACSCCVPNLNCGNTCRQVKHDSTQAFPSSSEAYQPEHASDEPVPLLGSTDPGMRVGPMRVVRDAPQMRTAAAGCCACGSCCLSSLPAGPGLGIAVGSTISTCISMRASLPVHKHMYPPWGSSLEAAPQACPAPQARGPQGPPGP
jgi:hypothetical protein